MEKYKGISGKLIDLMIMHGLTQSQVARDTGVQRAEICRIANGQHKASADTIYKICRTYGVSADWLMGLLDKDEERKHERESIQRF